jgi:uncharacterized protein YjiS (DUF1127 family)
MSLITIAVTVLRAFQDSMRQQACADLLVLDDHMLADLGLRREDLRAGLWQPAGKVDGEPPPVRTSCQPGFLADGRQPLL